MKFFLVILMLLISISFAVNAKEYTSENIYAVNDIWYDEETNNPLTGIVKSYYENGHLKSEIPFKNETIEGAEKTYYETGILRSETLYKNGEEVK